MTLESSGRCEFTEFMSNHILCYIHGDMLASVMNSEGVADKFGKDCGAAAPGLENLLVAGLVHLHDSLEQFRLHERSFFNASAHYFCSFLDLLAVAALHDKLIGGLLGVSRLIAECGLAPRSAGTGSTDRALALTAAVRVVVRVHDGAADRRADAHVAGTAGLADVHVLMVDVADLADDCDAVRADETDFAGRQTDLRILRVLGHQLGVVTGGADELCAAAGVDLDVVDDAFEYLMSKAQKGEKGQYFTPRYVIDMCVKMMNPTTKDKIIDTACGSSVAFLRSGKTFVEKKVFLKAMDLLQQNVSLRKPILSETMFLPLILTKRPSV